MTAIPSPALSLLLFGPPQISLAGRPRVHLRSRKAFALLALLALRHGRPVERAWVAGTLWPHSDRASGNLRSVLSELRQALGSEAYRLQSPSRTTLVLDLVGARVDVLLFDAAITSGSLSSLEEAMALYRGPLLEDSPEEWVDPEREARKQDCLRALETLATHALAAADPDAAVGYWQRAVAIDAWSDRARQGLMEALAERGDINRALHVYREFFEFLKSDPEAAPEPDLTALYRRLQEQVPGQTDPTALSAQQSTAEAPLPEIPDNLPHPLTSLIGREDECLEVAATLARSRLVTLTGPGGIGKTRLALAVATHMLQEGAPYSDGVWLVALETMRAERQVAAQIASALGIRASPGKSRVESLTEDLRRKRLLLLLDNCEHLLEASAQVSAHILANCPHLRILATSREPLGLVEETVWQTPSLAVPEPGSLPQRPTTLLRVLAGYESIQLFVERARAVRKDFALDESNALPLAQICSQLDGIPLAIELAAARIKGLTAAQIAARLNDRLELLTQGDRTAPPRQQTLRAMLDWSYALLSPKERLLFERLSAFTDGWTLEEAEQIGSGDTIRAEEILDLLTGLVDRSLVVFRQEEHGGRYRFPETVRQYAVERQQVSGTAGSIRQHHGAL